MQPSKKMKRMENKKKKLAALLEITELNHKERLESDPSGGPGGDCSTANSQTCTKSASSEASNTLTGVEEEEGEMVEESSTDHNDGGCCASPHKKKKRKSKHQDECSESESKRQKHSKFSNKADYEEWPPLVPTEKEKKKKNRVISNQDQEEEETAHKSPKYSEHVKKPAFDGQWKKPSSFTDELENFKKDMERSRRKKEKKHKKDVTESPASGDDSQCSQAEESIQNSAEGQESPDKNEDDELAELRKLLRQKKKQLKDIPTVRLKGTGLEADLDRFSNGVSRTPILPCDIQNFLMYTQLGDDCPRPRGNSWIELKKCNNLSKTVVLVVEGLAAYDYFCSETTCSNLKEMDIKAEMVSPYLYNANIVEELCAVALTKKQRKELERRFGKEICPEALQTDRVIKVLRSAFSITSVPKSNPEQVEKKITVPKGDKFPRTDLLMSVWQLIEEGYPLPFGKDGLGNRYPDYVMTKDEYAECTPSSPMWALDCEMCMTKAGNELTRVSMVDENHKTVYESLCMPPNPITNYLTEYSGITPEMMKGVTTRLEDIQRDLRELLPPDVILVGQSLNGDLHALKMMHPYVIDTSVIYNLTGIRRAKTKLSKLSMEFLKEAIQQRGGDGHDSVEDSLAALKLVQHKLTKSIEYGDAVLSGLSDNNDSRSRNTSFNTSLPEHKAEEFDDDIQIEVGPTMATSLFKHFIMNNRTVTLISEEDILPEYATFVAAAHKENQQLVKTISVDNNSDIISRACLESKSTHFTMAHMVLNEEDDIALVDMWVKMLLDCGDTNSLVVVIFVGSHKNLSNGACFVKVKKPPLNLPKRKRLTE